MQTVKKFVSGILLSEYFVLYLTLIYFLALLPFFPYIAHYRNVANIASNLWPLLAVAVGQTFVLIVAGIDLSQTSIMALTSVTGAMFMTSRLDPVLFSKSPLWGFLLSADGGPPGDSGWAVPVGLLVMLAVGACAGLFNGLAVAVAKMPPFIVTFVGFMFYERLAIFLTKSENIMHLHPGFIAVGKGSILHVPIPLLIACGVCLLAGLILRRTLLGRWLFATGANARVAAISGVPSRTVVVAAYIFSGICAAAGSMLYSARLECGRPTLGANLLLDIIGANIIGGNSLFGGKGRVVWTLFGVIFFVVLGNTLSMMNLDSFTIDIVKGGIILAAALVDVLRHGKAVK